MKKIITFLLLMILNANTICMDEAKAKYITLIEQELQKTKKKETVQQIDDACAQHRATLLESELGQVYAMHRKDWFGNNCADNGGSQACKKITENMRKALVNLQKTDVYIRDYLPAISEKYKNEQKFHTLLSMSSVVQQQEQAIDSLEDCMLHAIDSMKKRKLNHDPEPLPIWLEWSYNCDELDKQVQDELRGFVKSK